MIIALNWGDAIRTVSLMRPSARSDDPGGFLPRRVAAVPSDVGCSVFAEGQGERFAELLVLGFQSPDEVPPVARTPPVWVQ
jgi:hypothetical protein